MTSLDRETQAAIEALAYRVRVRDAAIRDGEDYEDPALFAQEFVMIQRHRGWRPTEACAPWEIRTGPTGSGRPESEEALQQLEEGRRKLDEIRARQQEERRRLAMEPPAGAA